MHEDERAQFLAAGEDLAEAVGGEVFARDMGHDLDAAKSQGFVQAFEFGDRVIRSLQWDRAEPDKAVRIFAADLGDEIVDRPRGGEPQFRIGAVIGLARRGRDRLDVDPHPVHVLDALFRRGALLVGALAIGAVDRPAVLRWPGFRETSARHSVSGDRIGPSFPATSRVAFSRADMAVDVDREPFAAGMYRSRKPARDWSPPPAGI